MSIRHILKLIRRIFLDSRGVAYQWFIAFSVLFIIPILWYALYTAAAIVMTTSLSTFPDSWTSPERLGADALFAAVWKYMPILAAIGALIWVIMRTLKEKRLGATYGY